MVSRMRTVQPIDLNPSSVSTKRLGLFGALATAAIVVGAEYRRYETNQIHNQDKQAITTLSEELAESQATSQATIARLELDIKDIKTNNETLQKSISSTKQGLATQKKVLQDLAQTVTSQSLDIKDLTLNNEESKTEITRTNQEMVGFQAEISSLKDRGVSKLYKEAVKSVTGLHIQYEVEVSDETGNKTKTIQHQSGTGVVIAHIDDGKKGGYILTNWHIVNHEGFKKDDLKNLEIDVTLSDGSTTKAKQHFYKDENDKLVAAKDEKCDVTLLVTASDISATSPIEVSMVEPAPGDGVIIIGSPFRLQNSVSRGIVSSLRNISFNGGRKIEIDPSNKADRVSVVQTDAAINPGNSGGAGINEKDGKLLFMPTFLIAGRIGFGLSAPELVNRTQKWIPYKLNASGGLVEIKTGTNPSEVTPPTEDKE